VNNSAYAYKKLSFKTSDLLGLLKKNREGFLLESSLDTYNLGRYSFFGIDPFLTLQCKDGAITQTQGNSKESFKGNIFKHLKLMLDNYKLEGLTKDKRFPFLGGALGFLSYDLGFYLENISRKNSDDLKVPDLWFAFFDVVLCLDHYRNEVLIFSTGFPEIGGNLRKRRAELRLKWLLNKLDEIKYGYNFEYRSDFNSTEHRLESNFSYQDYIYAVKKSLDYITKGDIYQINLSQRFHTKTGLSDEELYVNLKNNFPVPFGGFLKTGDFSIISASPERFLRYDGDCVFTRPMKGTRKRTGNINLDRRLRKGLENSTKDKAELLMIVDLERNDLGKVCDYGSIEVESLRTIEEYSTVFQTTSQVKGRLYPEMDRVDIIKACFPGGSITGCPKIRAMQIIEELEPNRRGIYTGSLGYFGFNGTMDFNILIRSFFKQEKDVYFGVGGGIVYDSKPKLEYEETLIKAEALKRALKGYKNEAICVVR